MGSHKQPLLISIGGGKGGVGKSMVSANLAVNYAKAGMRVCLVDLDFGAANVHTIFGIRQPPKGLGEYFFTPKADLGDYQVRTSIDNLYLLPGSGFVPELANLPHARKVRLIKQLQKLNFDIVLLDLGAGSAYNVIDFFAMTQASLVVTTPEPTSIVNAYEFLKNVVYRVLCRIFRDNSEMSKLLKVAAQPKNTEGIHTVSDIINEVAKKHPFIAESIREICADFDFYLVFNQARKSTQAQLGKKLRAIAQKHLQIDLNYLGMVYHNEEVSASVFRMSPISVHNPDSITCLSLKEIAILLFQHVSKRVSSGQRLESFEQQLERVMRNAKRDYQENLLTQRRLFRAKSEDPSLQFSALEDPSESL